MNKKLIVLVLVTLVVLAAAGWTVRERNTRGASRAEYGALIEGLDERVNDVAALEIIQGEDATTLERSGESWSVVQRGGYPAKFEAIKGLLVKMVDLKVLEPKTSRPENYAKLGVQDPGPDQAEPKRLILRDASGSQIQNLIVGNTQFRGNSRQLYVRLSDDPQVFLVEGEINAQADPTTWIEREIVKLESGEVDTVDVRHADGEQYSLKRYDASSAQFTLADIPLGRTEKHEGVANSVATALSFLSLEDVRPEDEVDFEANAIAELTFNLLDGRRVQLELAGFDDKNWVRVRSSFEMPPKPAAPSPQEDEEAAEDSDPAQDEARRQAEAEAAQETVRAWNERWEGWAYAIPEYKATSLTKRSADFLADPPAEETETPGTDDPDLPLELPPATDTDSGD